MREFANHVEKLKNKRKPAEGGKTMACTIVNAVTRCDHVHALYDTVKIKLKLRIFDSTPMLGMIANTADA